MSEIKGGEYIKNVELIKEITEKINKVLKKYECEEQVYVSYKTSNYREPGRPDQALIEYKVFVRPIKVKRK